MAVMPAEEKVTAHVFVVLSNGLRFEIDSLEYPELKVDAIQTEDDIFAEFTTADRKQFGIPGILQTPKYRVMIAGATNSYQVRTPGGE